MTISRKSDRDPVRRRVAVIAFGLSFAAHVAFFAIFGPELLPNLDESPTPLPEQERELVIDATFEEATVEEEPKEKERKPLRPEIAEVPRQKEEPVRDKLKRFDQKRVKQVTNEEIPELANYTSDEANRVPEETRARETVEAEKPSNVEGGEPPPKRTEAEPQEPVPTPDSSPEVAETESMPETEQSPVIIPKRERTNPQKLLMPDMANYQRVFAEADDAAAQRAHEHESGRGKKLLEHYEDNQAAVKASLENFLTEVKPGNHTGVNAHASKYRSYIGTIHHKIHLRWANRYLMDLDLHEPAGSPMNDPLLNTKLEFVIRASDGELESVNVVHSSGQVRFDAQALSIAHRVGPHPNPPPEIISPDGRVYIHWNFWRDQRQCGVFGARVYLVNDEQPG